MSAFLAAMQRVAEARSLLQERRARLQSGGFGLGAAIYQVFVSVCCVALSSRSRPEIRRFGPERLLSPKADTDKKSVYFCSADEAVIRSACKMALPWTKQAFVQP